MEYFGSYILYICVFAVSMFWVWQYEHSDSCDYRKKIIYIVLITFPVIIMQGFRYDVGTDYLSYTQLVQGFSHKNALFLSWYKNEPLFILIARISYRLMEEAFVFFVVEALLMNIIFFITTDYYREEVSMTRMYFMYYMLCLPYFFNAERQGLAIVIIWLSTVFVWKKKPLSFLLCILIAFLIHNTAIAGIVIYLLNFLEGKHKRLIRYCLFLFVIVTPFIFGQVVTGGIGRNILGKYIKFLNKELDSSSNINFIYWFWIIGILLIILRQANNFKYEKSKIIFLLLMQLITYLLNTYISYGFRMSFYYEIGAMYAYAYIMPRLKPKETKFVMEIIFIILFLFYFTFKFYIQGNSEIFPYKFIIGNI